jgi:hypothetical protein
LKKRRAVGDKIWVQRQEAKSKEWFKCEVTALKLIDGDAPGTPYEKGKWLPADRLRDKNDRK